MPHFVKQVLTGQFEAALAMLNECVRRCPDEHWEGSIATLTFRQVAYHTLFFLDLYLSPSDDAFELRELHHRGGDERKPFPSVGLTREETLAYVAICRDKILETMARETRESLEGPSGFSWRKFSRGELHIYNIRHVQHHTGQLSAYLRRLDKAFQDSADLPWIGSGWR